MNPRDLIHSLDEKACLALLSDWAKHKSYSETEGEKALVRHVVGQMKGRQQHGQQRRHQQRDLLVH